MHTQLERVLVLQKNWSSKNTADMTERGYLVRDALPGWVRQKLSAFVASMPKDLTDLAVEGRDGTGLKSEVPWVRIFSQARSPKATEGWYLVYLFDGLGERVYLSINQATTRWRGGEFVARQASQLVERAEWARSLLAPDLASRPDLLHTIKLPTRASKLARGYELGNVAAFQYDAGSVPADETLSADFDFMCSLLALVYEDVDNTPMVPGDPAPELIDGDMLADEAAGRSKRGGRFRLTSAERKAIEMRAVDVTVVHLRSLGYSTRDVGAIESYDLDARRGGERLFVEVKGTVSAGEQVILTRNEVLLHRREYPANMLAVVARIHLDTRGEVPVATGGELNVVTPWLIFDRDLEPLSYSYSTALSSAMTVGDNGQIRGIRSSDAKT